MKVLFYNHTGQVSGAERVLLTTIGRLDRNEFACTLMVPAEGPLAQMALDAGVNTVTIPTLHARFTWRPDLLLSYCKSSFRAIANFRRAVKDLQPDLIHANSIRAGLVAAVAMAGFRVPVVWHLHDLLPRHPLSSAVRLTAAISQNSRMLAVSRAVGKNFCGRLSRLLQRKTTIILNGIEFQKPGEQVTDREGLRSRLSLAKTDFALGIVGQLTPRKGQLELLTAFEKLLKRMPEARLVIVGAALFNRDSDYEDLLRETTRRLGVSTQVRILGTRSDVPEIMKALDLLVINSRREPFGLVACEAMDCGTPVLSTNCDGLSEIIRHQENGWLVSVGDEEELLDSIVLLRTRADLRRDLARRAKADVAQRFSIENYMNQLRTFYQTMVQSGSPNRNHPRHVSESTNGFAGHVIERI
jgi:glycosyltransferase involved in cell wall biosynthesis